jgi:hypothetical protein
MKRFGGGGKSAEETRKEQARLKAEREAHAEQKEEQTKDSQKGDKPSHEYHFLTMPFPG